MTSRTIRPQPREHVPWGIGLALALALVMGVAVSLAACTRENPGYGLTAYAGSTTGQAGTSASAETGFEAGTTYGRDTDGWSTSTVGAETQPGGETEQGDTEAGDTTDTGELCLLPAPKPFDVVHAPTEIVCDAVSVWTGIIVEASHDHLELLGCFIGHEPGGGLTCTCQTEQDVQTFTFSGLPVDVAEAIAVAADACVEISIGYVTKEGECETDWAGIRGASLLDTEHVLVAANRAGLDVTSPPIVLGEPRCDEPNLCNDGQPWGPHALRVTLGGQWNDFHPQQPLENVEMAVLGVEGTYTLKALHAGVDETCREHVGWVVTGGTG